VTILAALRLARRLLLGWVRLATAITTGIERVDQRIRRVAIIRFCHYLLPRLRRCRLEWAANLRATAGFFHHR
jgi:hypothetical protein